MTTMEENNKTLVLEAFNTLFNKRDYEAAARYWSPNYIQHSAHIEPGREGLFNLIKASPASLKYEPGVIVAEGDFVIVHGRFSGTGLPRNWIAADVVRIADGVLADIGTSSRTRRLARSRRVACQCSATASPIELHRLTVSAFEIAKAVAASVYLPVSLICRGDVEERR